MESAAGFLGFLAMRWRIPEGSDKPPVQKPILSYRSRGAHGLRAALPLPAPDAVADLARLDPRERAPPHDDLAADDHFPDRRARVRGVDEVADEGARLEAG